MFDDKGFRIHKIVNPKIKELISEAGKSQLPVVKVFEEAELDFKLETEHVDIVVGTDGVTYLVEHIAVHCWFALVIWDLDAPQGLKETLLQGITGRGTLMYARRKKEE